MILREGRGGKVLLGGGVRGRSEGGSLFIALKAMMIILRICHHEELPPLPRETTPSKRIAFTSSLLIVTATSLPSGFFTRMMYSDSVANRYRTFSVISDSGWNFTPALIRDDLSCSSAETMNWTSLAPPPPKAEGIEP